jgi:hypothetical protein
MAWLDTLLNPTGAALDYMFDSGPESVEAKNYYVAPDAADPQQAAEIDRLRAISTGGMEAPSVGMLRGQLRKGAAQSYGLAQSAGMQNAATQQRLARGARAGVMRQAPQLLEAESLAAQQQAAAALVAEESRRRNLREEQLQDERNKELQGEIDKVSAIESNRLAEAETMSTATEIVGKILGAIFSDENLKENIAPAGRETRQFIDSLAPKSFNYKGADPGQQQLGVLANDTSPEVVSNLGTEQAPVLGFEQQKVTPALLASVGQLGAENKRLRDAFIDLDDKLNAMTGDKRGAVQEHERRFEFPAGHDAEKAREARRREVIRQASAQAVGEGRYLEDLEDRFEFSGGQSRKDALDARIDEIIRQAAAQDLESSSGLGGAGIADPALHPPPSLDRANVTYAEDVKDQYPGWVENTPGKTWHTRSYDDTPSWLLNQWREQQDAGLPRRHAGGEGVKWLEFREGGRIRENRLPEFLEHNLRGYEAIGKHHVPYESREAKIEEMKSQENIQKAQEEQMMKALEESFRRDQRRKGY